MAGAPKGNGNRTGHGLYAVPVGREVQVVVDAAPGVLARHAEELAENALWVADTLAMLQEGSVGEAFIAELSKLIGLYAAVAQECYQVGAELAGAEGIKPAPLGNLSEAAYERLMEKQARSLEIILNQCLIAGERLRMGEEIRAAAAEGQEGTTAIMPKGLLVVGKDFRLEPHPVLASLAGHMRSAKRILREMAANRAWRERGSEQADDLSTRLMTIINGG